MQVRKMKINPTRLCSGRRLRRRSCFTNVFAGRALFLIPFFLFFSSSTRAQTFRIAAAADLQYALPDLAAQYEKQTGAKVAITYGSSGNFFAQIQNGAPFDLFLSADVDYPQKLIEAGLAVPDSLQPYAVGHLVLWYPKDSPLNPHDGDLKTLLDPRVQKIAIANPEHAPYGRVAVAALRAAGLYDQLKSKLVLGENVSQAAQFVQSGSAQAGLIALSFAFSPAMAGGKWVGVPLPNLGSWLLQAAVVLKSSPNKRVATSFLAFLKTTEAQNILKHYGFAPPDQFPTGTSKP
jgi:molybdate transport system substrate-binding protein